MRSVSKYKIYTEYICIHTDLIPSVQTHASSLVFGLKEASISLCLNSLSYFYFSHTRKCKSSIESVKELVVFLLRGCGHMKCSFKHFIWGESTYILSQWLQAG